VVRLEEGIRLEEDGGELGAHDEVIRRGSEEVVWGELGRS
jgi:hypothetical protein